MKELLIGKLPGRKGHYLSIREGIEVEALARFLSEEAADMFYKLVTRHDSPGRERGLLQVTDVEKSETMVSGFPHMARISSLEIGPRRGRFQPGGILARARPEKGP